jgi:hypothetical protein
MATAGRKVEPEILERHCSCRICVDLRADREASRETEEGELNHSSEV